MNKALLGIILIGLSTCLSGCLTGIVGGGKNAKYSFKYSTVYLATDSSSISDAPALQGGVTAGLADRQD